jgi:hypothetical protein
MSWNAFAVTVMLAQHVPSIGDLIKVFQRNVPGLPGVAPLPVADLLERTLDLPDAWSSTNE